MSTPATAAHRPWSLAAKLAYLRARLTKEGEKPPTTRDLASRTADEHGKPTLDHTVIHATLSGSKTNPPSRTILGLADAFDCPPAFLLPGSDDLVSLEVYDDYEQVREALRLIAPLGQAGAEGLLQAAHALRAARGLNLPDADTPPAVADPKPRPGRRLSRAASAEASRREINGPFR